MNVLKKYNLSLADIMITLIPLEIMAYFYYGERTVIMALVCMGVSFIADWTAIFLMKKKYTAEDFISIADGLAIALMMPASIDFKIPAISCVFAILIGKNLFGGRKNIIFSPCAIGYLFAFVTWGNKVIMYPPPDKKLDLNPENISLSHSLSYYFNTTGITGVSDFDILMGNFRGAMGTVSILILIVSAIVLFLRKAISGGAFTGVMIGILFMSYVCPINEGRLESLKYVMATNMFLFSAVYIVSDKRVAPINNYYAFFYGLFTAFISYILLLTTAKENMIITVSVIMTPVALFFKEVQRHTDEYKSKREQEVDMKNA